MKNLVWLLVFGLFFSAGVASADSKIVKWVDKQGVTHYGDRPPSFEESKSNIELNNRGLVVKKNDFAAKKTEVQDLEVQQKNRKDSILLASYTNANEIDLARDRSLEMNKAALTSLASQKETITARITRNNTVADGFKKRNKPLPANLDKEFKDALAQSGRIDKQIADRKLEMEQTRKNYADDKARFIALKQPSLNSGADSLETTLTTTPTAAGAVSSNQEAKK